MFGKLGSYLDLFRKGSEVSDPEKWKSRQITTTMVAGFIISLFNLAKAYGYDLPVSADDINQLGAGIIAAVNIVLTCTTSKRAGLLPAKPDAGAVQGEVQPEESVPTYREPTLQPRPGQDIPPDIYIG